MATWTAIDGTDNMMACEYSFGPGLARSFAVRGPEGWVVVSPPCGASETEYRTLTQTAPIAALVAPNAFHYLGLEGWHQRFRAAQIFAPAQSIGRIEKKTRLLGIKALAEARSLTGHALELVDMPHYKTGEALVKASSKEGPVWHVTDVIFDWPRLPPGLAPKLLFNVLTDSAPGFKLCGPASWIMMKDKYALYKWLKQEALAAPPVRLVPSHGDEIMMEPAGGKLIELLSTQGKA